MTKFSSFKFIILTPLFILLGHYLAVFFHEYAHSFMAWLLGYKLHPLNLTYGNASWQNLLFLTQVDENVNYSEMMRKAHGLDMALIAFAGPGLANGLFYFCLYYLLKNPKFKNDPNLFYFIFWFNFMNLGNLYDYVPLRTFSSGGDVAHLVDGLQVSPWMVFVIFGYFVGIAIWYFFSKTLISAYNNLELKTTVAQASLMILCVLLLFGYFAIPGILDRAPISHFLGICSVIAIPGIISALWPTRHWVQDRLGNKAS